MCGGEGGGRYSHIRAVRVCAIFRPGQLLKIPLFRPGDLDHSEPPPFKNIHSFVPLFRPGLLQKTPLLEIYVCWLFLAPPLRFSVRGRSKSPPFSVRGRFLSPPPFFSNSGRHIYTTFIYEYLPPARPCINGSKHQSILQKKRRHQSHLPVTRMRNRDQYRMSIRGVLV